MTFKEQLEQYWSLLSKTDQKCALFLVEHQEQIPNMTIAELAQQAHISEAAITRFCHKIKLSGFHELKIKLARQTTETTSFSPLAQASTAKEVASFQKQKVEELASTLAGIKLHQLDDFIATLRRSQLVLVVATGNTLPVAEDATYRLNQLGIRATVAADFERSSALLLNLNERDTVWFLSNSGESRHLLKMATYCQKQGISTLGVTNDDQSPLAQLVNYHIRTVAQSQLFQKNYYYSRLAVNAVVELLFSVYLIRYPQAQHTILKHEVFIAETKV